MSAPIPESEPAQLRAGDTLTFSRSLSDYPATNNWKINYSFRSQVASAIDFSSAASGRDHLVNVAAAITGTWLPGLYAGVGAVTDGVTVKTIWSGQLIILPNLASLPAGTDLRSQNRRILDWLNCTIEKKARNPLDTSDVEGTIFKWTTWVDLLPALALYQSKVRNEEIADLQAQGKPTGRTIFHTFTRPK